MFKRISFTLEKKLDTKYIQRNLTIIENIFITQKKWGILLSGSHEHVCNDYYY